MLQIYIGFDSREPLAYHVLAHSIMQRASRPVSITPLIQPQLRACGLYTRERGATESTEFSLTRFLVPYLSGYEGTSLFLDSDMLCQADICELEFEVAQARIAGHSIEQKGHIKNGHIRVPNFVEHHDSPAVWVCKHDYTPLEGDKFLGQQQTRYPRKNWSSLMLFDNAKCKALTTEYVNTASGLDLHRFNWVPDEQIGCLPLEWNWLIGEYPARPEAHMLHYTLGGPWFEASRDCDHADLWFAERNAMTGANGDIHSH
jgi:hypothetical protein